MNSTSLSVIIFAYSMSELVKVSRSKGLQLITPETAGLLGIHEATEPVLIADAYEETDPAGAPLVFRVHSETQTSFFRPGSDSSIRDGIHYTVQRRSHPPSYKIGLFVAEIELRGDFSEDLDTQCGVAEKILVTNIQAICGKKSPTREFLEEGELYPAFSASHDHVILTPFCENAPRKHTRVTDLGPALYSFSINNEKIAFSEKKV